MRMAARGGDCEGASRRGRLSFDLSERTRKTTVARRRRSTVVTPVRVTPSAHRGSDLRLSARRAG